VAEPPEPPDISDRDLESLGLYDPTAADADDWLRLLRMLLERGATIEELRSAVPVGKAGALALDLAIRPPGVATELAEFADRSDLDSALLRKLWAALGLPDSSDPPLRVSADMAEGLRVLVGLAGILDEDTALAVARVIGSSVARVAETITDVIRVGVELPQLSTGVPYREVMDGYSSLARDHLPALLDAVGAVFRRHLVLLAYQRWSTDEEGAAVTRDRTVGFADLVGSTQATREGSAAELAQMVRRFESQVWELVTQVGGRVVKLIGDEAMFVIDDPSLACDVALELAQISPHPVRIGLAHGAVVSLYGDYYGDTVILAARLVRTAEPASVVVSGSVYERARAKFGFDPLQLLALKGYREPVVAYRLTRN
jgi:class 3 adenylate cyclase